MSESYECYSFDGEDFSYDSIAEAINAQFAHCGVDDLSPGEQITLYVGTASKKPPAYYFGECAVDNLLEDVQCRADDDAGDFAEFFTYCEPQGREELKQLINDWANKHLKVDFYSVRNAKEITVVLTQEHFE